MSPTLWLVRKSPAAPGGITLNREEGDPGADLRLLAFWHLGEKVDLGRSKEGERTRELKNPPTTLRYDRARHGGLVGKTLAGLSNTAPGRFTFLASCQRRVESAHGGRPRLEFRGKNNKEIVFTDISLSYL